VVKEAAEVMVGLLSNPESAPVLLGRVPLANGPVTDPALGIGAPETETSDGEVIPMIDPEASGRDPVGRAAETPGTDAEGRSLITIDVTDVPLITVVALPLPLPRRARGMVVAGRLVQMTGRSTLRMLTTAEGASEKEAKSRSTAN
jgi:hypothetical protein